MCALPSQVPQHWMKYLLPKGFVAVDGCSLTVGCAELHLQAAFCCAHRGLTVVPSHDCCHCGMVQVGEVSEDGFSVYLIPETLRVTVLGKRQVGDAVNIEIDAQTQVCRGASFRLMQ